VSSAAASPSGWIWIGRLGEQVHGARVARVFESDAGRGARAVDLTHGPLKATDGLATSTAGLPLLLCFADCVPVVLVAPGPAVAVVHAGWRGALSGIVARGAEVLAQQCVCDPADLAAYVGPHIGACHYEVGYEILSQFVNTYGTVARAESGGLDLGAVVAETLVDAGVPTCRTAVLGVCTAEQTERFYSYRAEGGHTGRHGALACVLPS